MSGYSGLFEICQADNIFVSKFIALLFRLLHEEVEHYPLEHVVVHNVCAEKIKWITTEKKKRFFSFKTLFLNCRHCVVAA